MFITEKCKQDNICLYISLCPGRCIALYGFPTREEKVLFTKLLNVSGIGPKGALAILASGETVQGRSSN